MGPCDRTVLMAELTGHSMSTLQDIQPHPPGGRAHRTWKQVGSTRES